MKARPSPVLAALALSILALGCSNKLVGISASIMVTPTSLAFGQGVVGSKHQIRVSVSNVGSSPLEISAIKVATDPNNELAVGDELFLDCNEQARSGGTTLVPGECARFTVTWSVTGIHPAAGSVEIDSNDPQNDVVTLAVTGSEGIAPALQYCILTAAGMVDQSACSNLSATPAVKPAVTFASGTIGTAATQTVRLFNKGEAALTFAPAPALAATSSADFKLAGTVPGLSLAAGASADLTVTDTPSSATIVTGAISVATNDPSSATLAIPLTASVAATPSISVMPSVISFANAGVGVAQTVEVSVTNVGTAPLLVSAVKVATDPNSELKVASILSTDCTGAARTGGSTLQPAECARFMTVWTPTAIHAASGSIEVDSNDPINPAVTLPVNSNGASPVLQACVLTAAGTVDPTQCTTLAASTPVIPTANFGVAMLNTSVSRVVRLTNQGTAALNFSPAVALSAATSTAFVLTGAVAGNSLAAGMSTDLTITATPTAPGTLTGALVLDSNDQFDTMVSLPLTLSGAAVPEISVAPAALAFGSTEIGTPQQIVVSVSNIGTAPLVISSIAFPATIGNPNGDLTLDDVLTTDCTNAPRSGGLTLAVGECARFTAVWAPVGDYAAAGEVDISSNDPMTPTVKLPVTGNSVTPLLQICVLNAAGQVVPAQCSTLNTTPHFIPSVVFGTVQPLETSALKVQLTNQGNTALTFSPAPSLSGSAEFSMSGSVPGNSLAANASATLTITGTASTAGAVTGTLNIVSTDPRAPTIGVPITMTVPGAQLCATAGTPVAFGAVSIGSTSTKTFTMTNCGQTALTVNSFAYSATSPTTTQFTVTGLPAASSSIAVGATITGTVVYKPTLQQTDGGKVSYSVFAGAETLTGTVVISGTGALAGCGSAGRPNPVPNVVASYSTDQSGNGAYTVFTPAGTSSTSSPVLPLDYVKLDASTSTVGQGTASFNWTLASQPAGSQTSISSSTASVTKLQTLVSGEYVVKLVVSDSTGCVSATDVITFWVVPGSGIHIELTWAEGCGDLDLHYVAPGDNVCWGNDIFYADLPGTPYHGPGFPDWGCTSSSCSGPQDPGGLYPDHTATDDGTLDHDNVTGYGPENVTHKQPFDTPSGSPMQVWIYYYDNHGDCGNTTPTVNIYINGVLKESYLYVPSTLGYYFVMSDLWHVADIAVSSHGATYTIAQPAVASQLYSDYNSNVCLCEYPGDNGYPSDCTD